MRASRPQADSVPARPTTILVCATCRAAGDDPEAPRAGARLAAALTAEIGDAADLRVRTVECLSVCRRPVTIGFSAPSKWTYLYGDFSPDGAAEIVAAARLHAATPDGLIPWKSRPAALKTGVVARLPPLDSATDPTGSADR